MSNTTITDEQQNEISKAYDARMRKETLAQMRDSIRELLHGLDEVCAMEQLEPDVMTYEMIHAALKENTNLAAVLLQDRKAHEPNR